MAPVVEGNVRDGEPLPEGTVVGPWFVLRQAIGLLLGCAGVAVTVLGYDKFYYGLSNLAVTWAGLIVCCVGLALHETRPYKRWDDWTLMRGWFVKTSEAAFPSKDEGKAKKSESKKSK